MLFKHTVPERKNQLFFLTNKVQSIDVNTVKDCRDLNCKCIKFTFYLIYVHPTFTSEQLPIENLNQNTFLIRYEPKTNDHAVDMGLL